jgi:phosphoribosylamine--glycine ligase
MEMRVAEDILLPTMEGFREDGLDFRGVLFVGLMLTASGPKVIEFNNRFGDPETQSVLRRLDSDLLDIFMSVTEDRLEAQEIRWSEAHAVTVVMASGGYPGSYEKGKEITGLDTVGQGTVVFHAGTKFGPDGEIQTAGGRVLGISAIGATHEEARARAYEDVRRIGFEGATYRTDIGVVYQNGD